MKTKTKVIGIMLCCMLFASGLSYGQEAVPSSLPSAKMPVLIEAVPSSPTIGEVKNTVNKLLASSQKKIETTINKKDSATAKAITTAGDANANAIKDALKSINEDAKIRDGKIAKDANVALSINATEMAGVKSAVNNSNWILIIISLLLITIFIVVVRRSTTVVTSAVTAVGNKVALVERRVSTIPAETDALLKKLEMFTETFVIGDNEVTITAVPVDGSYSTLYVPKSFSTEIANPADITTKKAFARGELCAETIGVMKKYLAGAFDGNDGYSKNQKKVIENAMANGNLIIKKIV